MTINADVMLVLGRFDSTAKEGSKWIGRTIAIPHPGEEEEYADKMIHHGNGIIFVKSSTSKPWFQKLVNASDITVLIEGQFPLDQDGTQKFLGRGMAVAAFGINNAAKLKRAVEINVIKGSPVLPWTKR